MSPLRGVPAALLAAAAAAAATTAAPALPETRGWHRVTTGEISVIGATSARQTARIATELTRFREMLGRVTRGFELESDLPTVVVVFRNDKQLEPYKLDAAGKPKHISGFFLERPYRNVIALDASAGHRPSRIVYHEYVHSLLQSNFERLPLWLNEGLAEFYSTFEYRESAGRVEVGHAIEGHVRELAQRGLMPLGELFDTTTRSPTYNEARRQGVFYAQSWLLVHYLVATDERRTRFGRYLAALAGGADPDASLEAAFGGVQELTGALREYLRRGSGHFWFAIDEEREPRARPEPEPVPPGEVLLELGRLLSERGPDHAAAAEAHLLAALGQGGPRAPAFTALGFVKESAGAMAEAAEAYRKATAEAGAGAEAYARHARFVVERFIDDNPEATGSFEGDGRLAEARALFRRSLELEPRGVEALAGLGKVLLIEGRDPAEGLAVLSRAASLRPFRVDVLHDLVCVLAETGRARAAWAMVADRIEPLDDGGGVARSARNWIVAGIAQRAQARLHDGDRPGALVLLDEGLEFVDDVELRERLEYSRGLVAGDPAALRRPVPVEAGADTAHLVELMNHAGALANQGRLEEALAVLEPPLAECGNAALCERMAAIAGEIRDVLDHNRLIARYNEAVGLLNEGRREAAIERLRALQREAGEGKVRDRVRELLERLGER